MNEVQEYMMVSGQQVPPTELQKIPDWTSRRVLQLFVRRSEAQGRRTWNARWRTSLSRAACLRPSTVLGRHHHVPRCDSSRVRWCATRTSCSGRRLGPGQYEPDIERDAVSGVGAGRPDDGLSESGEHQGSTTATSSSATGCASRTWKRSSESRATTTGRYAAYSTTTGAAACSSGCGSTARKPSPRASPPQV